MAGLAENFRTRTTLMVSQATTGKQVQQFIAAEASARVGELIASGSASPIYRRFVNGSENAPNDTIRLDGTGTISYLFSNMAEAVGFALDYAIKHSPRDSGAFIAKWYLLVDTVPFVSADLLSIKPGAEVTLTNNADYFRKIDVGGMRMRVAPQIVEATRQAVMRKFPNITAVRRFITIPGGYVLKGHAFRSGISYDKKLKGNQRSKYFQAFARKKTNRADSRAGQIMTYPALIMYETV